MSNIFSWIGHAWFVSHRRAYLPLNGDWFGLGNRIKGMANFYRCGYRKFTMCWNTKSWVTDTFQNLFILGGAEISEHTSLEFKYKFLGKIFRKFLPFGVVDDFHPYWSFNIRDVEERIDFKFNEIPEDIRELYRPFFRALQPSDAVKERAALCKMPSGVVGVQIRNTGVKEDKKDVCSIETIYAEMEKEPDGTMFFISAMNAEISTMFKARFPGRIVELPDKQYKSMVDAVADMWLYRTLL